MIGTSAMRLDNLEEFGASMWKRLSVQNPSRPSRLLSCLLCILIFNSPHEFSVGFISENWDGHVRKLICRTLNFGVDLYMCFESSSWKIQTQPNKSYLL